MAKTDSNFGNGKLNSGAPDSETAITLGVLNAVHESDRLTQRSIASDLGIALGLANAYLKRCIRKGLIKVQQAPANRYVYYLTPKGFAEKSRLTAEYLSYSFDFFRRARSDCSTLLEHCAATGRRRVALAGSGELAEICALVALEGSVEIVGIVDAQATPGSVAGLAIGKSLDAVGKVDAVIVTDHKTAQDTYDRFARMLGQDAVLAPALLGVSRNEPGSESQQ